MLPNCSLNALEQFMFSPVSYEQAIYPQQIMVLQTSLRTNVNGGNSQLFSATPSLSTADFLRNCIATMRHGPVFPTGPQSVLFTLQAPPERVLQCTCQLVLVSNWFVCFFVFYPNLKFISRGAVCGLGRIVFISEAENSQDCDNRSKGLLKILFDFS